MPKHLSEHGGGEVKVGGIEVGASFRVSSNKVTLSAEMENVRLIRYIPWPPGYSLYKRGGNKLGLSCAKLRASLTFSGLD